MVNKVHTYKIKSFVNASHAVRWESGTGQKHNHTWEIVCEMHSFNKMIAFFDIEKALKSALDELSGQFLNELPEFETVNPTVENVTEYLFERLTKVLKETGADLLRIEVSDSPTRAFCIDISDRYSFTD